MATTPTQPMAIPHDGPATRRGKQLPPIQTSFIPKPASQRLQRPRPVETVILEEPLNRTPLTPKTPPISRPSSRMSLSRLFSRTKSSSKEATGGQKLAATLEEGGPTHGKGENHITRVKTIQSDVTPTRQKERPSFFPPSKPAPIRPSTAGADAARKKSMKKDRLTKSLQTWNPPPLFQAYPQSIKYEVLASLPLSADMILRMDKHKLNMYSRQDHPRSSIALSQKDAPIEVKKVLSNETPTRSKSRTSTSNSKLEWTTKVYVLATSGFLLQYPGEGLFDRYPEKILHLDKDSAAFASDAIPGELYVLQVSDTSGEDGEVMKKPSKSVFSRMGARVDTRKPTSNMLLIFDKPDAMNAWLVAIRKEIEAMGGKKYRPDITTQKSTEHLGQELHEKPSRRYLIQRDPNQFSKSPTSVTFPPTLNVETTSDSGVASIHGKRYEDTASFSSANRYSFYTQASATAPSTKRSSVSVEQTTVDGRRKSHTPSDLVIPEKTYFGPKDSPSPSPSQRRFIVDDSTLIGEQMTRAMTTESSRRQSFQPTPSPKHDQWPSSESKSNSRPLRPHSTGGTHLPNHHVSTAPNFSLPSNNKRFSLASNRSSEDKSLSPPHRARKSSSSVVPTGAESDASSRPVSIIGDLPSTLNRSPHQSRIRNSQSSTALGNPKSSSATVHSSASQDDLLRFRPTSSYSDRPVPRRFSSLEYSQGKLPFRLPQHSPSPHPPPRTALPAVPAALTATKSNAMQRSQSAMQHRPLLPFPLPATRSVVDVEVDSPTLTSPLPFSTTQNSEDRERIIGQRRSVSYMSTMAHQPAKPFQPSKPQVKVISQGARAPMLTLPKMDPIDLKVDWAGDVVDRRRTLVT